MIDTKVVLVHADDCVALYLDNTKIAERHSFDEHTLLDLLGISNEYVWAQKQLDDLRAFPDSLNDVVSDDDWREYEITTRELVLKAVMSDPNISREDKLEAATRYVESFPYNA